LVVASKRIRSAITDFPCVDMPEQVISGSEHNTGLAVPANRIAKSV
jgi:hypothetical protein